MNFNRYIIKGGIATPENPYSNKISEDPVEQMDIMKSRDEFNTWALAHNITIIGNVPDGVYDKEEFQPQVYINKHFGWQDCTHHISCYDDGQKLRLRLKEKKDHIPDTGKMVSVDEVVKVLKGRRLEFESKRVIFQHTHQYTLELLYQSLVRETDGFINKIKSL